jgi:hypothetical protein
MPTIHETPQSISSTRLRLTPMPCIIGHDTQMTNEKCRRYRQRAIKLMIWLKTVGAPYIPGDAGDVRPPVLKPRLWLGNDTAGGQHFFL